MVTLFVYYKQTETLADTQTIPNFDLNVLSPQLMCMDQTCKTGPIKNCNCDVNIGNLCRYMEANKTNPKLIQNEKDKISMNKFLDFCNYDDSTESPQPTPPIEPTQAIRQTFANVWL
jgi:hypothetical protein